MDIIKGVPALADVDPVSLVGQYSRDLRTFLDPGDLVKLPSPGGQGWGSHNVYLWRDGPRRTLLTFTTVGTAALGATLAQLDVDDRPPLSWYGALVLNLSGATPAYANISANGDVLIYWPTSVTPSTGNWLRGSVTWPSGKYVGDGSLL